MKPILLSATILAAFVLGCVAAAHVVPSVRAEGVQSGASKECIAVTTYAVAGKAVTAGQALQPTVLIPPGWDAVGAGDRGDVPFVMVCRAM